MEGVQISNPQAEATQGVRFTGTLAGEAREFLAQREALEDLEYTELETAEALLAAFRKHEAQVARVAARALEAGGAGQPLLLQSLL